MTQLVHCRKHSH